MRLRLLLLALVAAISHGQTPAPAPLSGSGSPVGTAACSQIGQQYFRTSDASNWNCTATGTPGTWSAAAGGATNYTPGAGTLTGPATSGTVTPTPGANAIVQAGGGGTIAAGFVPTLNQNTTGNAATATALASAPSGCTNQWATGVAANGNASCADITRLGGVLLSGLGTGIMKLSSGTPSLATAGTDYQAALGYTPLAPFNNLSDVSIPATAVSNLGAVPTSRTVNGRALTSNITILASDITLGTLPHAQLPTLLAGDIFAGCHAYTYTTGTLTVDFSTYNCAIVTASGANPTLAFTAPGSSAAIPLTLGLCNDTTARTWTLPGTALQAGSPAVASTCFYNNGGTYDGTNYQWPGSNETPSVIRLTSERSAPPTPASGTGVCWPDSTDHSGLECMANNSANVFKMFLSGADCNPVTGVCTKTNGSSFTALATTSPGTGIATFLSTPSSANLIAALTDETGTGAAVFGTSPTIVTPTIASFTNATHNHTNAAGGGQITDAALSAAVGVAKGGTGAVTLTGILKGNGTTAFTAATVGTDYGTPDASAKTFTNTTIDAEGTGNTITIPFKVWMPAAGCNNTTAASFWDLPTSTPAVATCVTGTNTQKGVLAFADTSGGFSAQNEYLLPSDWTGNIDAKIIWSTSATTGNAKFSLSTVCTDVAATATDDPAFNTASTVTTAAPGTANRLQTSSISAVTITGCTASSTQFLHIKLFRDGNDGADTISATANVVGVELTVRRAL